MPQSCGPDPRVDGLPLIVMAMRADELVGRHEVLAIDIDRLHLVATSPEGALPEARMRRVVTRELLDLCAVLEQHFAAEEVTFEEIAQAAGKRLASPITELRTDHQRILGQLHHLSETAMSVPIDVLKLRISDLLDSLGEHERAESGQIGRGR